MTNPSGGYVDTAPLYGSGASERRIGLALRQHPRGPECVAATKLGYVPQDYDYSFDATIRSVEASRERLGLDRIPIVQIHEIRLEIWDAVVDPHGALAALRKLRADGVIGHIGVTGSDVPTVLRALATGEFETVFFWHYYHLPVGAGRRPGEGAANRGALSIARHFPPRGGASVLPQASRGCRGRCRRGFAAPRRAERRRAGRADPRRALVAADSTGRLITSKSRNCHPERSEGSDCGIEMLRCGSA